MTSYDYRQLLDIKARQGGDLKLLLFLIELKISQKQAVHLVILYLGLESGMNVRKRLRTPLLCSLLVKTITKNDYILKGKNNMRILISPTY